MGTRRGGVPLDPKIFKPGFLNGPKYLKGGSGAVPIFFIIRYLEEFLELSKILPDLDFSARGLLEV